MKFVLFNVSLYYIILPGYTYILKNNDIMNPKYYYYSSLPHDLSRATT